MKSSLMLLIMVAISSVACAEEKGGAVMEKTAEPKAQQAEVSLPNLLERQTKYKDHKVVIAAYFVTSMEGSWICAENGDWRKRLQTTLSVKIVASPKFKVLGPTRSRIEAKVGMGPDGKPRSETEISTLALNHGGFEGGVPVLITGTFRVGEYSNPNGLALKNHPFIELEEIEEVQVGDPRWKAVQTQTAKTAEAAPSDGDKPPK